MIKKKKKKVKVAFQNSKIANNHNQKEKFWLPKISAFKF